MIDELNADIKRRMEGALGNFDHDLMGLRTGRASVSLLDGVAVEVYGSKMPISQVGTVSAPEARLLSVQVWDQGNVDSVMKAINQSGLGLNPSPAGNVIRVPLPELTQERRKELAKVASQYAERSRVAVRNVRRDAMDSLKKKEKDGEISKDEQHDFGQDIQKTTDEFIKRIDKALAAKEQDILEV
jgi:ribosome recycling factor